MILLAADPTFAEGALHAVGVILFAVLIVAAFAKALGG